MPSVQARLADLARKDAEDFDLAALVQEKLDQSDDPDPKVVTEDVLTSIMDLGPAYVEVALRKTLPRYVTDYVRQQNQGRRPAPSYSRARAQEGNIAAGLYRQRMSVNGKKAFLGDLTRQDVLNIAERYERQAEAQRGRAADFRNLARVMEEKDVDKVADLPISLVTEIVGVRA